MIVLQHSKQIIWTVVGVIVALIIVIGGAMWTNRSPYRNTHTTTIFVHGYASSYHAEEQMANYLVQHHASNTIVRANVSDRGHVKLINVRTPRHAKNPIVEMNYDAKNPRDNMSDYNQWLKNVVVASQKRFGNHKINLVGHSMGTFIAVGYLDHYGQSKSLPRVTHLALLAGGIFPQMGSFTSNLQRKLPTGLHVLNVYSNYRHGTDTRVPNKFSRNYKSVFGKAKQYKVVHLTGLTHSQIHESEKVDRILIKFLFATK